MPELDPSLAVFRVIFRHTEDTPIRAEEIESMTQVPTRTVAEMVSIAIAHGVPLASSSRGYFRSRTNEERERYLERENSRLISLAKKVSSARKALTNPLTLFEQEV